MTYWLSPWEMAPTGQAPSQEPHNGISKILKGLTIRIKIG